VTQKLKGSLTVSWNIAPATPAQNTIRSRRSYGCSR